ncbi:hypothetical protein GGF46_004046 [Coemansia sp. RSA 552]|nr:hypothetical protein GGF46_004046 [Coemansia sp. RSA 552]
MATYSAGPALPADPPQTASDARAAGVLAARLVRCRRWLHFSGKAAASSERYDAGIGLASPSSASGDVVSGTAAAAQASADAPASGGDVDAAGGMRQPANSPLVELMNGRWSGCVGPTISNRSLTSRQGLRARASAGAPSRYCSRPVTAATHMAPAAATAATAAAVAVAEVESDSDGDGTNSSTTEISRHNCLPRTSMPISPMSMAPTEPRADSTGALDYSPEPAPCGAWDCMRCAGATSNRGPSLHPQEVEEISTEAHPATDVYGRLHVPSTDRVHPATSLPLVTRDDVSQHHPQMQPPRRNSLTHGDLDTAAQQQRDYHSFSDEYLPEDSAYAEYATESMMSDSEQGFDIRDDGEAGLGGHIQAMGGISDVQMEAPSALGSRPATAVHEGAAGPQPGTMPSPPAIAQIFLVGQPAQDEGSRPCVSRARRASRRMMLAISRVLHIRGSRLLPAPGSSDDRACSTALLETLSAESALAKAIQLLERSHDTRSPSFRMRADRVHVAQAQLLNGIHELFLHLVSADEQRSRHYRFYLPEDDQMELDRGFSESVLFAAQALARGFQIRGTEGHTHALREPAWMLCSVWTAVRFVLFSRSDGLWSTWAHGRLSRRRASQTTGAGSRPSPQGDLAALRRVLEDFDEAWVRFERDLCFAYFGLNNAQVAGLMDPNDTSDTGQIAQEEEFSLLVVLLSETLQRCLAQSIVSTDQMEAMDPQLILALPRLAILHAIAVNDGKGVDGLCFVESEGCPVFWWFREYADVCRQLSDRVGAWPPLLYRLLQKMLIAEEADKVLAEVDDAVLLEALDKGEFAKSVASPERSRSATAKDGISSASQTPPVDLESIIDSPRSARSLSIDDCISSMYTPTCLLASGADGRPYANSSCCTACEALSARFYAAYTGNSSGAVPPMLPDTPPSTLFLPPSDIPAELLTGSTLQHPKCTLAHAMSPALSSTTVRSATITATAYWRDAPAVARIFDEEKRQKERLETCRAQLQQSFVDVCSVADTLHSGPFARPFRLALELVFRINLTE